MAEDIKIVWNDEYKEGDLFFEDGDLTREEGLETAIMISLFTDRRARNDDPLDDPEDRRGWWGDQVETNDQIGSRLWLLDRAKTTAENLRLAGEYIKEALQWLISDGVARKVEVTTERAGSVQNPILAFQVQIYRKDGNSVTYRYSAPWQAQFNQ